MNLSIVIICLSWLTVDFVCFYIAVLFCCALGFDCGLCLFWVVLWCFVDVVVCSLICYGCCDCALVYTVDYLSGVCVVGCIRICWLLLLC